MSSRAALEAVLRKDFENRVVKLLLADCVQEEEQCDRMPALRVAAKCARDARNEFEITLAGEFLKEGSLYQWSLHEEISALVMREREEEMSICVMPGSRPPEGFAAIEEGTGADMPYLLVQVGARWVIREVARTDAAVQQLEGMLNSAGESLGKSSTVNSFVPTGFDFTTTPDEEQT